MREFKRSGFTIVELLVVIIIIAILTTVAIFSFLILQRESRDSQRSSQATIIAEALEKYYEKNGEYPSPKALTNDVPGNTGTVVADKLGIARENLIAPRAPTGTTNSISTSTSANDNFAYIAKSTVNNSICQSNATAGCDEFTLSYKKESDGSTATLNSRRSGRPDGFETTPAAPPTPTITAVISSTSIVATSSVATCEASTTPKYSFQNQTGSGAWSSWSTWSTSRTYSRTGNTHNTVYSFRVKARCDNGPASGIESNVSLPVSVNYLAAPSVSVAPSGADLIATTPALSCASGGTVNYQIDRRINNGSWTTGVSGSSNTLTISNAQAGARYGFRATVKCIQATRTDSSAVGLESVYTTTITAPAAPIVTIPTSGDNTTWTWNATTCPSGTSAEYQLNTIIDSGYNSGWLGPYTNFTTTSWGTSDQGYEYTRQVQTRCVSSYGASAWSATGQASYIRPIDAPGPATNITFSVLDSRTTWRYDYTAPSCGPGAQAQHRWNRFIGTQSPNQGGSMTWPSGLSGWEYPSAPQWSDYGFWVNYKTRTYTGTGGMPINIQMYIKLQYICVNPVTGRTSAWGPIVTSQTFKT